MDEPRIEINGRPLSAAQAMAVRVACTSFHAQLATDPDPLGDDEHGRRMASLYVERLSEVLRIMLAP
jgi:hypothetical protein